MTRILYWNINNFSLGKISNTTSVAALNRSFDRLAHIIVDVMGGQVPDIFAIVEVYSRTREISLEGTVLNSGRNAGRGARLLLNFIRGVFGNQWCLVPPLMLGELGMCEGVAVFYNSTNLQFIGPCIWYDRWIGTGIGQAQMPGVGTTINNVINYPTAWRNCLPYPANPIPALQLNRTHVVAGAAVPESQFAGQWQHYTNPQPVLPTPLPPTYLNNRINFPNRGNRSPFLTEFLDLTVAGGGRTIKLYTVHTSPATAAGAVHNLDLIPGIVPGANEVSVIAGDFNVDTFGLAAGVYDYIVHQGFALELTPLNAGAVQATRKPYCMTHLLPTAQAMPYNNTGVAADPQHNVYPRYGYMGSSFPNINNSGAIDNILTQFGAGAAGAAANISVVNTVIGTPYNGVNPAPANVTAELTGGLAYAQTLANPLTQPTNGMVPTPGGVNPAAGIGNFQNWNNFGRIHSTSDHLALVIEV